MQFMRAIQGLIWPSLCAAAVLVAFCVRGSDTAGPALALCALFALLAGISWLWPLLETPPLAQRRPVLYLTAAFGVLVIALAVLPLDTLLTGRAGGQGGLFDPSSAWLEYLQFSGVVCAFALGLRVAMSDEMGRRLLDAVLFAGGLWALASIVMHILDPSGIYGVVKSSGFGRLTGAFSSPNSAGALFGSLSVLALGRVLSRLLSSDAGNPIERISPVYAIVWMLCLAALLLSTSRGAMLATGAATLVLTLVLTWSRLSLWLWLVMVLTLLIVLAAMFAAPMIVVAGRFEQFDADAGSRMAIFRTHFEVAIRQPWFGSGLGSFDTVNNAIMSEATYPALSTLRTAHNVYLQWFEETGLTGLTGLLLVNLAILVPMLMAARVRRRVGGRLWAIALAYLVFWLHGLTDYGLQEPANGLFIALLLGAGFGLATNIRVSTRG